MAKQPNDTKRRPWPDAVVNAVTRRSLRRCALCVALKGDLRAKSGQIAHIDRNHSNSAESNACWLCLRHHDEYDSKSPLTRGMTPAELRERRDELYAAIVASGGAFPAVKLRRFAGESPTVPLEVYDRRYPLYKAGTDFIKRMLAVNNIELQTIFQFYSDTEQALFLFDDQIAAYYLQLAQRGMSLRATGLMINHPNYLKETPALVIEQTELISWFAKQHDELRSKMIPFLRVRT